MNITYLGHAGFCVETPNVTVVMDPWLNPAGAYDSAWFQFPCNHHLAEYVQVKLADSSKKRYVYISHEHKDHFDLEFLKSLRSRNFTFVVPHFRRATLRTALADYRCDGMIACVNEQAVSIPDGFMKLYLADTELNRDSAILVKSEGCSFLNLNDSKIFDRIADIVREQGPIDVLAAQFSGATWHPTCYDYSRENYESISTEKMLSKFETVAKSIATVRPRLFLPSAGPPCFLDPMLFHLNFEPVNIFPHAFKFTRFLDERLKDLPSVWPDIMPGDILSGKTGVFVRRMNDRVDDANFESYLKAYARASENLFTGLRERYNPQDTNQLLEMLSDELNRKLEGFTLHKRITAPLYFHVNDIDGWIVRIDFPNKKIEQVSKISDARYYSISAPAWQIRRVLAEKLTWEDFSLTFRMRLSREPDVYQTLIQGFLILQAEDINWFCAKMLDIESNQERLVVEMTGRRYAINRLCPHQGADLKEGWIDEERYMVCARHGWRFDLINGGKCTTNETSLNAFCLED